jgi:hypothetical protein
MKLAFISVTYSIPPLVIIAFSAAGTEKIALLVLGGFACCAVAIFGPLLGIVTRPWRQGRHIFAGACVSLAVIVSTITTAWPLRITFALSRPSFERLTDKVQAGYRLEGPERAGFFVVKQADLWGKDKENVCLWMDLDPAGKTGFVRGDWQGNVFSEIEVDADWRLVYED